MNILDRFKYLILVVFLVCIAAGSWFSRDLNLDPSLESRFLKDNPQLEAYKEFGENFGSEPLLLVVWKAEGDVWDPENFAHLRELTSKIEELDGVKSVISIAALFDTDDAGAKKLDARILKGLPLVRKLLVDGESRRSALFIVPDALAISPSAGLKLVKNIENVIDENAFVTGPLAMQSKAIEFSRRDLSRMLLIVAVFVVLIFGLAYRSWQAVMVAVLVTAFTLSGTCGILALLGLKLSQFALIALPILAVAGLEDVVFLLRHYGAARSLGADRIGSCRQMFASSGVPCVFTTLTTMTGFASLFVSDIEQIRSIGLVLVVGGPLALAASLTITPAVLLAWPCTPSHLRGRVTIPFCHREEPEGRRGDPVKSMPYTGLLRHFVPRNDVVTQSLVGEGQGEGQSAAAFVSFISKHAGFLAVVFIVASLIAGYGIHYTKVRFDFPKIFRPGVPFQKQLQEIDDKLAGGASFELLLKANDGGDFSESKKLNQMVGLQTALSLTGPVATTVSPIDIGITAFVLKNGIPENPKELLKNAGDLIRKMGQEDASPLSAWLSKDLKKARIHVRVRTDREKYYDQLLSTLAHLKEGFGRKGIDMTWSGFSLLYKEMEKRMVSALVWSFVISFASVLLMLMVLLRSVKWGLVAMVPNILPIAMVMGIIGWLGGGFSLGLIILPAVGIGLIVDDTIHFIWGVRRYLKMGYALENAIAKTFETSGVAMIFSSLILAAGFASLLVSPFVSNVELAIFMPLLIFLTLVFDLVGAPVMILILRMQAKEPRIS